MTEAQLHGWMDVRDWVHARILDRTYRPGDKLPRDADLALALGCARTTVHRAMRSLAEDGIVERRRKGGTTVRTDPVTRATLDIPITRLEVEAAGKRYGYRLLSRSVEKTPRDVAKRFELKSPEQMLRVQALHLADEAAYIFEDRWISLTTVPEILDVDLTVQNANEWLVRNRPYDRCDVQIHARTGSGEDARRMGVADGASHLVIERTTWISGAPITLLIATTAPGYRLLSMS